jgi:hypothetical protein
MADCGFENKQKGKKGIQKLPLLAILPGGPPEKIP